MTEGTDEEDGAVGLLGKISEGWQAAREARDGGGGIEDDQAGVKTTDGGG